MIKGSYNYFITTWGTPLPNGLVACTSCRRHLALRGLVVNTQAQTHTQIHIHAQIPAYVQLPALFQLHVPLQPSTHLHCNQAPCPATISIDPPFSAEMLIITRRPCIISEDGNKAAAFYLSALRTLATRSQVYWKDHSPSTVSI